MWKGGRSTFTLNASWVVGGEKRVVGSPSYVGRTVGVQGGKNTALTEEGKKGRREEGKERKTVFV